MDPKTTFFIRLAVLLSLPAALAAAAPAPAAPAGAVVHLPEYKINDSRALPEPEHWRYTTIPNYEIISTLSDDKTQALARDLAEKDAFVDRVWPGIKTRPRPKITLILCGTSAQFDSFVPTKVSQSSVAMDAYGLFFHAAAQNIVVLSVTDLNNGGAYENDLLRNYILARIGTFYPKLPKWFAEGLARIVAGATVEEHRGRPTVSIGAVQKQVSLGGDDMTAPNVLTFNQYFAGDVHGIPAMPLIFGDPPSAFGKEFENPKVALDVVGLNGEVVDVPNVDRKQFSYGDWVQASTMLTHLCFYGEKQHLKPALLQFLELSSNHPGADPAPFFTQAFHKSYADMETVLASYVAATDYSVFQFNFNEKSVPATVELRDATVGEIGQIKGDAYRLADLPAVAREELGTAYRREKLSGQPYEARLLAGLGVLEAADPQGDHKSARAFLETAADGSFADSEIYEYLAQLRLADFGADHPLSRAETDFCLAPLQQGMQLASPQKEFYEGIALVWARSAAVPSRHDLAVLNEGIHYFPDDTTLALAAIGLNAQQGYDDTAQAIADFGANSTADPAARAQFSAWLAKLPSQRK